MTKPALSAISRALVGKGQSFASWARATGHNPDTVRRTLRRWIGREDRTPQGPLARQILSDLTRDTGITIVPGIDPSPKPSRKAA